MGDIIIAVLNFAWSFLASNTLWTALASIASLSALYIGLRNSQRLADHTGIDYDISLDEGIHGIISGRLIVTNRRDRPVRIESLEHIRPKAALHTIRGAYDLYGDRKDTSIDKSVRRLDVDQLLENGDTTSVEFALVFKNLPPDGAKIFMKLTDRFHTSQKRPNITKIEGFINRHQTN